MGAKMWTTVVFVCALLASGRLAPALSSLFSWIFAPPLSPTSAKRREFRVIMTEIRSPWSPAVSYCDFTTKTDIHWFRTFFRNNETEYYVNPWIIGQMSPVLKRIFLDESFADAENGEVCLPEEWPENMLIFLQATVPGGYGYQCKPISGVTECIILMRYANIWLIDGLKEHCGRYLTGDYKNTRTTLTQSVAVLQAACEYGCDDKQIMGILIGRCAAFGGRALLEAKVHESTKLTPYAASLLFWNAHGNPGISGDKAKTAQIRPIPECSGEDVMVNVDIPNDSRGSVGAGMQPQPVVTIPTAYSNGPPPLPPFTATTSGPFFTPVRY